MDLATNLATIYLTGIIVSVVMGCIFGAISKHINESKGYYGGFAWGFWLGIIGIIVVAVKPNINVNNSYCGDDEYTMRMKNYSQEKHNNETLAAGGWTCTKCGAINPKYLTTCNCGMFKGENERYLEKSKEEAQKQETIKKELDNAEMLLKLKKMLDEGIITQEEFDEKKKQLLQI